MNSKDSSETQKPNLTEIVKVRARLLKRLEGYANGHLGDLRKQIESWSVEDARVIEIEPTVNELVNEDERQRNAHWQRLSEQSKVLNNPTYGVGKR